MKAREDATRIETGPRYGKIHIVVPVFNRKSLTERFLHGLRNQTFRHFETVVVDDGSTDGTAAMISERFGEVHLLRGDGNLWWTGGINLGIRYAMTRASETDAILVINDDLQLSPDYLENLHTAWQSMPETLIGSVVVDINDPDVIYDGGRTVNWWTAKFRMLNSKRKLSEFPKRHCVDVSLLTGWGTLVPIRVFREIGLYDDEHFQQCGDTELPVRAKNAGYRLVVNYAAVAKLHIDGSDGMNVATYYSPRDLGRYFLSIKSNFRLKYRFFFSLNTATSPLRFVSFLLFDLSRIACHFLLRLRFRRAIPA